ncbi:MAG: carboxy terminal-processing peptidase [Pseudomonadota bacterium]
MTRVKNTAPSAISLANRLAARLTATLSIALLVAGVATAKTPERPLTLQPEPNQLEASRWATTFLTRAHYKKTRLDDTLSSAILDRYLESLDPNRVFFMDSDVRQFEAFRTVLDDALKKQDLSAAFVIFNVYAQRVNERIEFATALLEKPFDFEINESLELDRSEAPWAKTETELNDIWRRRVKNDMLRLRLANKEEESANDVLRQRYENLDRRVSELDSEDVFQYYMNAFALSIEPHTGYLAPRSSENFQISMRLSLEGIGAVLQRENEYTTIRRVVPGGPASKDGRLKVGDRIISVTETPGEEATDVVGWRLDDVVELIRGTSGTEVVLEVIPAETGIDGQPVNIGLVRDKVKLEEQAAQSSTFEIEWQGSTHRIGVIDLPAFYLDFAARARRDEDYRSSTRDVRALIAGLKNEGVDGIVMDLRNNGGGSLAEATDLTGLFIDRGPVVQVRDSSGKIDVETDGDRGAAWEGPLVVLVNRHSASASEIFAAAIQDYGRGVVIGEPTFGKGTVQNLINLDRYGKGDDPKFGQLKLTIAQFFRVNGGSTQHRGVIPDIIFPTAGIEDKYGESSLDNALPWTSIPPTRYKIYDDLTGILPVVEQRSQERLENDAEFKYLLEDIATMREARDQTRVSLLEEARRAELEKEEELRTVRKAAREAFAKSASDDVKLLSTTNPDIPPEALNAELETANDYEDDAPDVLLNETVRILGDIISLTGEGQRTAALTEKRVPETITN